MMLPRDASAPLDPALLAPHLESIRRLARGLVAGDDLADDVVQETWIVALRRPPAEREHLGGWLAGIARNVARNLRRGQRRRLAHEAEGARPEAVPSSGEVVERIEEHRRVLALARELEEPYRTTLVLRYFDDLTPTEIATRLGRPVATVKTHLRRGLERLRSQLDAEHGGDRARWQHALGPLAFAGARPRSGTAWSPWGVAAAVVVAVAVGTLAVQALLRDDRSSRADAPDALVADGGQLPGADGDASSPAQRLRAGGGVGGAAGAGGGLAAAHPKAPPEDKRERVIPVNIGVGGGRVPATVVVRGQDLAVRRFPVGEDGLLHLRDLPDGMYVAWIESPSTLTSSDAVIPIPYRWDRLPSIVALPAASLEVRVVDATAKEPIAGATVAVHEGGQSTGAPGWTGLTGADGRVRIPSVPGMALDGLGSLRVCATGPGHQAGQAQVVLPPKATSALPEVTVALSAGAALRGRAVDGAGVGVGDAVVLAAPKPQNRGIGGPDAEPSLDYDDALLARISAGPSQVAVGVVHSNEPLLDDRPDAIAVRTGPGGAFDLEGLRPGLRYEIVGFHPGRPRATAILDPALADGGGPLTLAFVEFGSAVLAVTDLDGVPLTAPRATRSAGEWRLVEGKLTATRLVPGWQHAWITAPGHVPGQVRFEVEPGRVASATVRLRPALVLRGVVVGSDGTPVAHASVGLDHGNEGFVEWEYGMGDSWTQADANGAFSFEGAPAGRYSLYAHGKGYRSRWGVTTELPGEPVRLVLEPRDARRLALRVAVPAGARPPDKIVVHVHARPPPDDARVRSMLHEGGGWRMPLGMEQTFPWGGEPYPVLLEPDATELVVIAEGYAPADVLVPAGTATSAAATLSPGRTVRGTLLDEEGRPIPGGVVVGLPGVPGAQGVNTAADGSFALEHLPLGNVTLWSIADGFLPAQVEARGSRGDVPVQIRLRKGVVVQGLVTGWDPALCECASLKAIEEGTEAPAQWDGWEASYQTGRFRMTLPPGRYVLEASQSYRAGRTTIVVEEGKPLDVAIEMVKTKERPER